MHAIIMAGGEGQRLRPLTCISPKPLIPVLGKPVMAYTLALCARHGITDIHVTLGYLPEEIENAFGTGEEWDVRMHYYREREPLGTAGGVREAAKALNETFVVLSGDALTDCDLTAALEYHRKKGALATLVLKKCEKPLEYGVAVTAMDGRIERFIEKPGWDEAVSDWVNTGIYILEPQVLSYIPQGRTYDFGRELFPFLLKQGLPLYGYPMKGYWCDVGDIQAYVASCADLLDARAQLDVGLEADEEGNYIAPDARISEHARIVAPCYIGPGVQIAPGALVGPHAALERQVQIARGARVKRSVVRERARIGMNAALSGAVIGNSAQVGAHAVVLEGGVLGDGAVMEEEAVLESGARIWPQKRIEAGQHINRDVIWGNCLRTRLRGDELEVSTPQEAMQGACAWARLCRARRVALMHTGSAQSRAFLQAAAAQLCACGITCLALGAGSDAMLRAQSRMLGAQAAILFKKRGMVLMDGKQCPPIRAQQRAMEANRGGMPENQESAPCIRVRGAREYYITQLCEAADIPAITQMQPHGVISCPKKRQERLVRELIKRLGLENIRVCSGKRATVRSYETGFFLSPDGRSVQIADAQGTFSAPQAYVLGVLALLGRGERTLILSTQAPQAAQAVCVSAGAQTLRIQGGSGAFERALADYPVQKAFYTDGLYAIACLITCFVHARTMPRALLEQSTKASFSEQEIPCAHTRIARVLSALAREMDVPWEGGAVQALAPEGSVTLYAPPEGARIRIIAQARDMEAAAELCARVADSASAKAQTPEAQGVDGARV